MLFARGHNQKIRMISRKCTYITRRKVTIVKCLVSVVSLVILYNIFIADGVRPLNSDALHGDKPMKRVRSRRTASANVTIPLATKKDEFIEVEVLSSRYSVYVSINGSKVYENNKKDATGMNVIVINQYNGLVTSAREFDTYIDRSAEVEMVSHLSKMQRGRIIVIAVRDEGSAALKGKGRKFLGSLGSRLVDQLGYRDMWAFISMSNKSLGEVFHKVKPGKLFGDPASVRETIQLHANEARCKWGDSTADQKRAMFCWKYDDYGDICNCKTPALIDLKAPALLGNRLESVPIAIVASNRPRYLNRMLRRLLTTPGVSRDMVTVFIDGYFQEVVDVIDLYEVSFAEHEHTCEGACRIASHCKFSFHGIFARHPHADYAIIIEEDLEVSEDFMDYFSQLLPVLALDESVYCISAWNDIAYEHSCHDPSMLYRVDTMPGLGWMLKKKLFQDELEAKWPLDGSDWDMWMRAPGIRKGRECIIPDVSRTYHFATKGMHVGKFMQDAYFAKKTVNNVTGIKFDARKVIKEEYEKEILRVIKRATILDHSKNPCTDKDFVPDTQGKTYLFFIKWAANFETWISIAECYRLWDLDARGFHRGLWRFWIKKNHIIVIDSASPYFIHKPSDVVPINLPRKKKS